MYSERIARDQNSGSGLGQDLKILDGIASWCGALHGSMPLDEALAALGNAISAEAAVVSRDSRNEGRSRVVAQFDVRDGDRMVDQIKRAYASEVLGGYFNKIQAGAVWFLSDHLADPDFVPSENLNNWRANRAVSDVAIVALETTGIQFDYLEFHFSRDLSHSDKTEAERVFPTLVRAWAGRKTGLVTQSQMDERMIQARIRATSSRIGVEEDILGVSNPAKLSRAEFRVCLLLSRGLAVKAVTEELGLSEATVRSHLRSIYAKTATKGLAELVYRILSNTGDKVGIGRRSQRS
ncbi:MAG: helix-turn-helix transcriptional regulator [Boseongicola sp.]|nr:MAG: helix-turn-helix transcriptional regulator [Boseongicola sp.]